MPVPPSLSCQHEWLHTSGLSYTKYFCAVKSLYTQQMLFLFASYCLTSTSVIEPFANAYVAAQQMVIAGFQFNETGSKS